MEDISDILENISTNFYELDQGNVYMKQQIVDFYKTNKIKIDFNYWHIAFSQNGGLIAMCKTRNYLDTSRNSKINKYIIYLLKITVN